MTTTAEITELVQKKIKDLPPLPLVVQKLIGTLEDDNSSADDVMKVLSSDQALASKVLKLVNSSFYGLSGEISTPSRAVVILGFAAIRNLAIGLSVAKFMSLGAGKNRQNQFWDHSIATAAACQVLAKRTSYPDAEEAFIAGLLHDIGQIVLGVAVPQGFTQVLEGGPANQLANEEKIIGMTHAKAGQMLLKHWKLPRPLTSAIRFHHNPKIFCGGDDPLTSLVALADSVANVHGEVFEHSISSNQFQALVEATGFDVATTGEMLHEVGTRIEETKVFLQIAADTEIESDAAPVKLAETVVMICTDKTRMTWAQQILDYYGIALLSMKDYFADPDTDNQIDAIILDPGSVTAEQLLKMKPRLATASVPVLLYGGDENGVAAQSLGGNLATLPIAFSRRDFALNPSS